jgi:hypothetical protein
VSHFHVGVSFVNNLWGIKGLIVVGGGYNDGLTYLWNYNVQAIFFFEIRTQNTTAVG